MKEFFPTDYLHPLSLAYWRYTLWRSQYFAPSRLQALQWNLLSRLVRHCRERVPYYQEHLGNLRIRRLEDLLEIPILKKDAVWHHFEEFKAQDFSHYRPRPIRTSGTTGSPLTVYWDKGSNIMELACQWRHMSWQGYRLGQTMLDLRGRLMDTPLGYRWHAACRVLEMTTDGIDEVRIVELARLVRRFKPVLWRGHPLSLYIFCKCLEEAGIQDLKPLAIVSCSESLLPSQREFIGDFSGVRVCDSYGLSEHNALITQCLQGGYHIHAEYGLVEILRPDGEPAKPGEEGRIVATGLHSRAFPLLRYDTGDTAVVSDRVCPCGRTLPLVEEISGLRDDYLLSSSGDWVSGLRRAIFGLSGIRFSQLVQSQPNSVEVYLVPTPDYVDQVGRDLVRVLKLRLGEEMIVSVHLVDRVPIRDRSKYQFVVNRLDRTAFAPQDMSVFS